MRSCLWCVATVLAASYAWCDPVDDAVEVNKISKSSASSSTTAVRPSRAVNSELKSRLSTLLRSIEKHKVSTWETYPEETAEDPRSPLRVRWKRGVVESIYKAPKSPRRVDRLWAREVRRKSDGTAHVVWIPLYWHPDTEAWRRRHPHHSRFTMEEHRVEELLQTIGAAYDVQLAERVARLYRQQSSCREEEQANPGGKKDARLLADLTQELGARWGAGTLLRRAYETSVAIRREPSVDRKVALARERRSQLRALVALVQ